MLGLRLVFAISKIKFQRFIWAFLLFLQCGQGEVVNNKPHSLFATKTPYEHRIVENTEMLWTTQNTPADLKPILIDATLRHGTRFPSTERVDTWKDVVLKFQRHNGSANAQNLLNFSGRPIANWSLSSRFPENSSYLLASVGWEEHVNLGLRYYGLMPELWSDTLKNKTRNFHVTSSSKIRSRASARAFVTALQLASRGEASGTHPDLQFDPELVSEENNLVHKNRTSYGQVDVAIDDKVLRYFDHCPVYRNTVDQNDSAHTEFEEYFDSHTYKNINLYQKMPGMAAYHSYQICAFESAVYGSSPWCELFGEEDLLALEYASDIKHYYKTGHGYSINYLQSCVLLKSVINSIEGQTGDELKSVLRFGHAETVIPLTVLLNFTEQPTPLKATNYEVNENRAFRTGRISPFASNLAITLYKSTTNGSVYVSFALNEVIIKPFGLDCHFCPFGANTYARQKLDEIYNKTECDSVCVPKEKSTPEEDELSIPEKSEL